MKWLNLIWIVPLAVFYLIPLLLVVHNHIRWAQTRKLNWQLYGDKRGSDAKYHPWLGNIVSEEVLCPVCEKFILTFCWKEHLKYNHNDPTAWNTLDEMLTSAKKRMGNAPDGDERSSDD